MRESVLFAPHAKPKPLLHIGRVGAPENELEDVTHCLPGGRSLRFPFLVRRPRRFPPLLSRNARDIGSQRATKDTKSSHSRRFQIEPEAMPLLTAMYAEDGPDGHLITMPDRKYWATALRDHLRVAGVNREELFATDDTRLHIRFHELKATAVT